MDGSVGLEVPVRRRVVWGLGVLELPLTVVLHVLSSLHQS